MNATSTAGTRAARDGDAGLRTAELIRAAILAGDYPPGTRMRQEDLAQRFGASRVPVREALLVLERDGLVSIRANAGAWVTHLTLAECEEIYRMRERLEPLLLRYSAEGLPASTRAELRDLAARLTATTDVVEFLDLDRRFHMLTYSGAHTSQLGALTEKLFNATQAYRAAYTSSMSPADRALVDSDHALIVTGLDSDDLQVAELALAAHIRRTSVRLARHPELFRQE
ncbi:GntR family transcriptional regulator [Microbacterium sp. HMH0099]|uniref:GntR family transcriptional regulator n=1 Tax=Microbacterium sp. HMH0099 TaxID=3414026 RepID=UPI003BF6271C